MFLSSTARMHQYYSACLQQEYSCVARWFLTCVSYGRTSDYMPPRPTDPHRWLAWNSARKWPIVSIFELPCPFSGQHCPAGWHARLPWFDRFYDSYFSYGVYSARDVRAIQRSRAYTPY